MKDRTKSNNQQNLFIDYGKSQTTSIKMYGIVTGLSVFYVDWLLSAWCMGLQCKKEIKIGDNFL